MLDMRVPVWVSDMAFMEDPRRVATCHRHSAVRMDRRWRRSCAAPAVVDSGNSGMNWEGARDVMDLAYLKLMYRMYLQVIELSC